MAASPEREDLEQDETAEISPRPRLVFTQAPILLAKLLAPTPDADGWRVRIGSVERTLAADDCVDPVLLRDAAMRGARLIVDATDVQTDGMTSTVPSMAARTNGLPVAAWVSTSPRSKVPEQTRA